MGSLLGIENKASVAVFASLRNSRAQRDALRAAALVTLAPDLKEIFDALMNIHRSLDSLRNDIVHGIWGKCDGYDEGVIWTSLQDHAVMLITDYHAFSEGKPLPGYDRRENMLKDYFLWSYSDLEETVENIKHLARSLGNFHGHLRYKSKAAGENALRQLLSEALVQKEIERMRDSVG